MRAILTLFTFLLIAFTSFAEVAYSQTSDLALNIDCKGAGGCASKAKQLERDGYVQEALIYYEKAGLKGSKNSFAHLAGHHFFGIGTPQNTQEGYKYLILSTTFNVEHEPRNFNSFIAPYKQFSLEPEIEATILKAGELAKKYANEHRRENFYREKLINAPDLLLDDAYINKLVKGHLQNIQDTRNGRNFLTELTLIMLLTAALLGLIMLVLRGFKRG